MKGNKVIASFMLRVNNTELLLFMKRKVLNTD